MTLTDLSDSRVMDGILYSYEYDELNRRSKETAHYIPGNTLTKTYSYSPLGAVSGMLLSGNEGVFNHDYHYDPRGRLSAATLPGNQNINLQLNNDGTPSAITHGNNIITNINYNANGLIKTIATNGSNSAQPLAVQLSYQHDAENNIRTITSEQGNHTFYYDRLNRLTGAQYPPLSGVTNNDGEERPLEENFEYDYGHNLSKDDGNDWVFDKNHRITEKGDLRYHYDPDGNLTSKTTLGLVPIESHSYDTDGRRIGFQKDNTTANYQYDPLGRRISKTVEVSEGTATHTTQTWYLWHNEKLLAEYHSNGAMQKRYAYLPGRYLPEQMEDANGIYTIHGDHLETPRAMTDASGNVVWKMHNTAFGDAWIEDDLDEDGNAITLNIRFPGQYFDLETEMHYNYFRDYAPGLGRYVQSDPIGLAGGINIYGYAGGSPLLYFDPYGLEVVGTWSQHPVVTNFEISVGAADISGDFQLLTAIVSASGSADFQFEVECRDTCSEEEWNLSMDIGLTAEYQAKKSIPTVCAALPAWSESGKTPWSKVRKRIVTPAKFACSVGTAHAVGEMGGMLYDVIKTAIETQALKLLEYYAGKTPSQLCKASR